MHRIGTPVGATNSRKHFPPSSHNIFLKKEYVSLMAPFLFSFLYRIFFPLHFLWKDAMKWTSGNKGGEFRLGLLPVGGRVSGRESWLWFDIRMSQQDVRSSHHPLPALTASNDKMTDELTGSGCGKFRHFPRRIEQNHKILSQNGRDSSRALW
jgi:hypothetical protein